MMNHGCGIRDLAFQLSLPKASLSDKYGTRASILEQFYDVCERCVVGKYKQPTVRGVAWRAKQQFKLACEPMRTLLVPERGIYFLY